MDSPDYERLETEARALGMRPGTLARVLLRASLKDSDRAEPSSNQPRLAALARLTALARGKPPVDAVQLVAEARADFGSEPLQR